MFFFRILEHHRGEDNRGRQIQGSEIRSLPTHVVLPGGLCYRRVRVHRGRFQEILKFICEFLPLIFLEACRLFVEMMKESQS